MTDELEPIDDSTKVRRKIDHTLARFSAAHDELAAEEAKRKERMERLAARPARLLEQTRTRLQRVVAPLAGASGAEATRVITPSTDSAAEAESEQAKPQTRLQEKKQRKNERSVLIGRISLITLAVLIFLAIGAAWGTKTWFNSKFTEIAALDENSADIQNALAQTGDENFLIAGSDTRAGATAEENVGSSDDVEGARSDTVMLAHVPADRKRAVVISFPRDLEISRPSCNRFDSTNNTYTDQVVPAATKVKLNTAYAIGGPRCLTKWVQQLTGLKINHFVGIDFSGFKDMVDAVGGVNVHLDSPIKDTVLGMVVAQTGDVTISGDQALSFVRARHVIGDPTSDYGRIKRQQDFIGALLTKVMSHGVLTNPGQLTEFVNAFAKATFGDNIGVDQLLTLAQSMKGLDASKVNFMTVPTTGEANSRGNEVLQDTKAKALFQALIDNTALPGTSPASPTSNAQAGVGTSGTPAKADQ
ncbi:MAG TPA: LCP family protein [Amycolatopsis sp.]|nr:LCP family protein [Amycolatopsis sp.]